MTSLNCKQKFDFKMVNTITLSYLFNQFMIEKPNGLPLPAEFAAYRSSRKRPCLGASQRLTERSLILVPVNMYTANVAWLVII